MSSFIELNTLNVGDQRWRII